jgi:hypothetical protein
VLVVLFSLMLCRCFSVFGGEQMVSVCQMSMMACRFVGTSLMMLRRLPMMAGGVFVVFSSFLVMLRAFMLSHFVALLSKITRLCIA